MDKPNRTNRLLIFLAPLGVACVAALLLLKSLSAPQTTTPAPLTPTPNQAQEVVARVGELRLTFTDWAEAFYLDTLMSHFSGQPAPTADETLERLVNDTIILTTAAEVGIAANQDEVEARTALLLANWGLTEDQLAGEMRALGLNRQSGVEAVARLLTVERYLAEVVWASVPAEEQTDTLDAWLQARRAEVGVEIDTRGRRPSLPTTISFPTTVSSPLPPPTPTSVSVLPPTATPLAASPLATPSPLPSPPTPTATPVSVSPPPLPPPSLAVGQPAPDFALSDVNGQPVSLSDYRDQRRVVIVFLRTTG